MRVVIRELVKRWKRLFVWVERWVSWRHGWNMNYELLFSCWVAIHLIEASCCFILFYHFQCEISWQVCPFWYFKIRNETRMSFIIHHPNLSAQFYIVKFRTAASPRNISQIFPIESTAKHQLNWNVFTSERAYWEATIKIKVRYSHANIWIGKSSEKVMWTFRANVDMSSW